MARITVRPDLTGMTHLVAVPPTVKIRNLETGEIALDRDGKTALYTVELLEVGGPAAQVIKITVPETGLSGLIDTLATGQIVRPVGLVAAPWGNYFGGQVNVGLSYRADALVLVTPAVPASAPAAKAETPAK